ncbi:hypothetical protein HYQ45_000219 [Verticillium longisporum]|nr:hypothetical protein HYQ44_008134 [Verticillium longisporum]KAG7143568.1 hypothetical protein HYQ45_000219 [Verticillium longisporum]CRK31016.1 hypothetical protein BN1723_003748 [Verticillium longisporum]
MKLFNVHGIMFEAGKDFPTQDIEFNSTPALDLADAKTTKEIIELRMKYGAEPDELDIHLAYRFGDYVVKYNLVPSGEAQKQRAKESVDGHPDGVLHEWLRKFYQDNDAEYLFQVQLLENLDDQPVEYAGKEWDSEKYPWQTVAKLAIPKQESFDKKRNRFWVDDLRIDPWHGLVKLQPLGSPNRLRRIVYPASSSYRRQHNGRTEVNVGSFDEVVGF